MAETSAERSSWSLLRSERFGPLFFTQFLGAFNDNLFRTGLSLWIVFELAEVNTNLLVNVAAGLFILPFFLLSTAAGQIADKMDKAGLIRRVKLAEILIMTGGAAAWWLGNSWMLFTVLLAMGSQSAFFGPSKYSILPQHLDETELVGGNALIEMGTFLAILLGTILGGLIVGSQMPWLLAPSLVVVAVLGYLTSRGIPAAAAPVPELKINWNPLSQLTEMLSFTRREHYNVLLSILGISWFWLMGSVYLTQIPNYVARDLNGGSGVVTLMLASFSLGIGLGAILCARLCGHKVEIGVVPFGALGLSFFAVHLSTLSMPLAESPYDIADFVRLGGWRVILDVVLLSMFGALFIVPLNAFVQNSAPPEKRARIIALNNILNAFFMIIAAVAGALLLTVADLSIPQLFLTLAVMNIVVSLFIFQQVPLFAARFLVWLLGHSMYRVRHEGLDNIPESGPALIACNHVSYVDALILAGAVRRPIRFVMIKTIYDIPVLNFVFRVGKTIPIVSKSVDPQVYERAFDEIDQALAAGDLVCIFPEGALTHDGEIGEFKAGIQKILARRAVPVIPMALRGLWGSFFSASHGGYFSQPFRRIHSRIDVVADLAWAPEGLELSDLRRHILGLRGDRA